MPNDTTPAPNDKGASDKIPSPHSELRTQLSKHETFHERVKAVNAALRRAKINPSAEGASERSREVLSGVLGDDRLVEMYLRQLWSVGRSGTYLKFPSAVLVRNGQTIRSLRESLENETSRQRDYDTPAALGHSPNL